jgi:hypothetical protein
MDCISAIDFHRNLSYYIICTNVHRTVTLHYAFIKPLCLGNSYEWVKKEKNASTCYKITLKDVKLMEEQKWWLKESF